jgi:hypothetical protein
LICRAAKLVSVCFLGRYYIDMSNSKEAHWLYESFVPSLVAKSYPDSVGIKDFTKTTPCCIHNFYVLFLVMSFSSTLVLLIYMLMSPVYMYSVSMMVSQLIFKMIVIIRGSLTSFSTASSTFLLRSACGHVFATLLPRRQGIPNWCYWNASQ